MRLAILGTRGIPARYGGFETFAERLAVGLVERGFVVGVFCESNKSFAPDIFHGVKLHYVSAPSFGPLKTIFFDLRSLWAARKAYDVVYMLGYGAAPFCLIPRLWGTEVWINPDGLEWARSKWGVVGKSYLRLMEWVSVYAANRIIADSGAIATSLASRHGRLASCTVIPYGCEVIETPPPAQALSEWKLTPGSYYIVVCRLEPENHVLEILQGFKKSQSRRQLVVVGNHLAGNVYVSRLLSECCARIQMIGTVYEIAKLVTLRYHSFGYLHGHSVGGTNPSLLEAMGCGNLIFAHDNLFNRETLGGNGLFFKDSTQLAELIDQMEGTHAEGNSPDLEILRAGARSRALAHYQWPAIIDQYAKLLDSISPSR